MKPITKTLALCLMLAAGPAAAADGVTNPLVKARMDTMQAIRPNVAVLGDMASGKAAFDAAAATTAKAGLVAAAAQIPVTFQPNEADPVSKAKPEIWTSWADFAAKAEVIASAAAALDPSSLDGVKAGMGAVGATCKDCHTTFRN